MSQTAEQLSRSIVAAGLIAADEINALWGGIPSASRPKTGEAFLEFLITQGRLTSFQAKQILAGRAAGLVLGEYVVLSEIGAGGMGRVYKARHRRMDRIVALKMMSAAAMKDEAAVKRFRQEARAAARLDHPNIVAAHDAGESGKAHFLVMQYVDGGDLADLVKKQGPLPIEKACDYMVQTARGLAYAHGEGIIHRDIKPANLLVDKKGSVKILDMGLARFEAGDNLTATEQVMGTVDYMSPEQAAETKNVDGRADIYSLGCTLWYLLTGKKLYEADSLVARIMKHRDAPLPTLVVERPDAPEALDHVLRRMVAKRPDERFQTMEDVAAALTPFAGGSGSNSVLTSSAPQAGGSHVGVGSAVGRDAELASFMKAMAGGEAPRPIVPPGLSLQPGQTLTPGQGPARGEATAVGTPQFDTASLGPKPAATRPAARPPTAAAMPGTKAAVTARRPASKSRTPLLIGGAVAAIALVAATVWALRRDDGENAAASDPIAPAVATASDEPQANSVATAAPAASTSPTMYASNTPPAISVFEPPPAAAPTPTPPTTTEPTTTIASVTPSVAAAPSAPSTPSTAPAAVVDGTWNNFFSGKDLSGWREMATSGSDYEIHELRSGGWTVAGGLLRCDTTNPGWLRSDREYGDFEMELEFKSVNSRSNSGIYVRSPTAGRLSRAGMEVQILGQGVLTGGITPFVDPKPLTVRAPGEWNGMRIVCIGPIVNVDLNGARVLDLDIEKDPALKDRPRRGYLGIANWQGLAAGMEFRNVRIRVPAATQSTVAATSTPSPPATVEPAAVTPPVDFKSWKGLAPHWKAAGTEVAGSNGPMGGASTTFFAPSDTYRDFELACRVKLTAGNTGIQFRSAYIDPTQFVMRGPQVDLGPGYWGSLFGEAGGGMIQAADAKLVEPVVRPGDFNDVVLRCYGKHVTIRINNVTTIDGDFPALPDDGRIGIQLHKQPTEVVVRDLSIRRIRPDGTEFTAAGAPSGAATTANDWKPLFTTGGRQPYGTGNWTVNQGIVRSTGGDGWLGTTEDYDDFELALEFKLPRDGNSGIFLRANPTGDIAGKDFIEIQLIDDLASKNAAFPPINHSMAVVPHVAPREVVISSPDQWHDVQLRVEGSRIEGRFNGRPVLDVDLATIAAPNPGLRSRSGRIGLQAKGSWAEFRNIRVRKLGAAATTTKTAAGPSGRPTPGFTSLFNGKDLVDWGFPRGGTGNWVVENGAITCTGGGFNRLYSLRGDYRDVHVRAEVKISDGGNGGLHVRTPAGMRDGGGYEAQVNSTSTSDPNRTGSLFFPGGGIISSVKQTLVPPDTWFTYEVVIRGNRIVILVNGTSVTDYVDTRNLFTIGHIGLEHHDPRTRIYFRRVEIKELR